MTGTLDEQNLVVNFLTLVSIVVGLAVMWRVMMSGRKLLKATSRFFDDWNGEPARAGREARPGFPERIRRLESGQDDILRQLNSRSPGTIADAVDRIPPNPDVKDAT